MRQNNENYDNIDVVTIIMMMIIEENLCGDLNNNDDY